MILPSLASFGHGGVEPLEEVELTSSGLRDVPLKVVVPHLIVLARFRPEPR